MGDSFEGRRAAAKALAILALATGLTACAGAERVRRMGEIPAPREGAMSAEAHAAAQRPTSYPKFTDIPPTPDDVRPAQGWDRAVGGLRNDAVQLKAQIAAAPPPPTDTAAFAARAVAEVKPPPSPDSGVATSAFAAKAQAAVKPPTKPK